MSERRLYNDLRIAEAMLRITEATRQSDLIIQAQNRVLIAQQALLLARTDNHRRTE